MNDSTFDLLVSIAYIYYAHSRDSTLLQLALHPHMIVQLYFTSTIVHSKCIIIIIFLSLMLSSITAHSHVKYVHVLHHQYCANYANGCMLSVICTMYVISVL